MDTDSLSSVLYFVLKHYSLSEMTVSKFKNYVQKDPKIQLHLSAFSPSDTLTPWFVKIEKTKYCMHLMKTGAQLGGSMGLTFTWDILLCPRLSFFIDLNKFLLVSVS